MLLPSYAVTINAKYLISRHLLNFTNSNLTDFTWSYIIFPDMKLFIDRKIKGQYISMNALHHCNEKKAYTRR